MCVTADDSKGREIAPITTYYGRPQLRVSYDVKCRVVTDDTTSVLSLLIKTAVCV